MLKTFVTSSLAAAVGALVLSACGPTVEVRGKVTDSNGTQTQALVSGATPSMGGTGTVSAATQVRAEQVGADGSLSLIADAKVDAQGNYSLRLPEGDTRVVIEAVDAQGNAVASVIVDSTANASGGVRTAAPITRESSLETSVFVQLVKDGGDVSQIDTVDLRSRIDASLAASVAADASGSAKAIAALADAIRAAQEAELKAYAKAGVTTTQSELFSGSLEAAAKLDAALDAGTAADQAWADFYAAVRAGQAKVDEKTEAEGERSASASFRATVKAEASGAAWTEAATHAAAKLEARASEAAVKAVLEAGSASQATIDAAVAAGAKLRADLDAATTTAATVEAWTTYRTSLTGGGSASVLGGLLGVNVGVDASLAVALGASANASATLGTALDAAAETTLSSAGKVDVNALTTKIVDAFATFEAATRAQATALSAFGAKASPAVEVMVVADGSFK